MIGAGGHEYCHLFAGIVAQFGKHQLAVIDAR